MYMRQQAGADGLMLKQQTFLGIVRRRDKMCAFLPYQDRLTGSVSPGRQHAHISALRVGFNLCKRWVRTFWLAQC
jgi:hypothetical protein